MKEVLKQIDEEIEGATVKELEFAIRYLINKVDYLNILKEEAEKEEDKEAKSGMMSRTVATVGMEK